MLGGHGQRRGLGGRGRSRSPERKRIEQSACLLEPCPTTRGEVRRWAFRPAYCQHSEAQAMRFLQSVPEQRTISVNKDVAAKDYLATT